MAIDSAMGLVPISSPLESQTVTIPVANGQTVFKGQVVALSAGAISPHAAGATGVGIAGVCMEYKVGIADLSVEAIVCVDPLMVYKADSSATALSTDFGFFGDMVSNGGSADTGLSTGQLDNASFVAAPSVSLCFQHLGIYDVVTDVANTWIKVRLSHTLFNDRFGLDT
jgi:hypothetical protein